MKSYPYDKQHYHDIQQNQDNLLQEDSRLWSNLTEIASGASFYYPTNRFKDDSLEAEERNTYWFNRVAVIFIFNGIICNLYWSCLMSTLDYFSQVYKGYNVYLYFPIPNFVMGLVVAIIFNLISTRFTYQCLIIFSLLSINFLLVSILGVSILCKQYITLGFAITMLICTLFGLFGMILQLTYSAMFNYFNRTTVSNYNIGVGVSGLLITILRMTITAVYESINKDDKQAEKSQEVSLAPVIVFLAIAVAINFVILAMNIGMFGREVYRKRIVVTQMAMMKQAKQHTNKQSYARLLWGALVTTNPYPIYIFFNGVINFMLYPNLTMAKKTTFSKTWSNLIFLLMFNSGNLLGKIVGGQRVFVNSFTAAYMIVARLFFFYTIPFMDTRKGFDDILLNNNYFPFVNQAIFAFSSGMLLNSCFILTFQKAPIKYKKYAGVLNGTLSQLGVTLGTFLAIPLAHLVNPVV